MSTRTNERSPEHIMHRAQLWGEVFAAKDKGEVLTVQVVKPVRGGYMVQLPCGLTGFLHCFDRGIAEGEELEARITVADYVSKEIKLKRIRDRQEMENTMEELRAALKDGRILMATVRSVVRGGMLVDIMGLKAFIPSSQTPLCEEECKGMLGKELPVQMLKVSRKSSVASHKKALEANGNPG